MTEQLDPEMFLLRRGQRRLVKRERVATETAAAMCLRFESLGLTAVFDESLAYGGGERDALDFDGARRGHGSFVTVFVARDPDVAAEALTLERASVTGVERPRDEQRADFARLGELLGYPACCIRAYAEGPNSPFFRRGAAAYHLEPLLRTRGRLELLLNNVAVPGGSPLISHAPCAYDCAASVAIAQVVLDELRRLDADEAARLVERLGRPTLYWSQDLAYELDGVWDGDELVLRAAVPLGRPSARVEPYLVPGARVRPGFGAVRVSSPEGDVATLLDAEAPLELPFFMDWSRRSAPPISGRSVVLADVETADESYMGNPLPALAGDLLTLGFDARSVRVGVGRSDEEASGPVEQLVAYLDAPSPSLVVVSTLSSPRLRDALDARGASVLEVQAADHLHPEHRDPVGGPGTDRLEALVRALEAIGAVSALEGRLVTADLATRPLPFAPVFDWDTTFGDGPARRSLWCFPVNSGCPFALAYSDPGAGEYLPSAGVRLRGCNFCADGANYSVVPWRREIGARLAADMEHVAHEAPWIRRYVVHDTFPLPYLTQLTESIAGRGLRDKELLLQCRPDWLLRHRPAIEQSVEALGRLGWQTHYYLIGFENFSQPELDRLDKGLTVAQNLAAIAALRALEERYPGHFSATRYPSHGFLLFNPWTRLEDLEENAAHLESTRFHELRSHYILTRLRLYPWLPHYHKAHADGLVTASHASAKHSSARRMGYLPETPWRSADARADVVFGIVTATEARFAQSSHARLLGLACEFARRYDGPAAERVVTFEREYGAALSELEPAPAAASVAQRLPLPAAAPEAWEPDAEALIAAGSLAAAEALVRSSGALYAGSAADTMLRRIAVERRLGQAESARAGGRTAEAVELLEGILADAPEAARARALLSELRAG